MHPQREGATATGEDSRADVLTRLARLIEPDVDDRTRTEQTRTFLTLLGLPAMLVDLDGTVLDCSEQMSELGADLESLRGRPVWAAELWDIESATSTLGPLIEAGEQGRAGQRTIDIGGTAPGPVRISLTPIVDGTKAVAVLLIELKGLADSSETEALIEATNQALTAAEDIFRAVAEHTSDLVCLHDPDGTFTYVSPSMRRLLDLDPASVVGTHPLELAHDDTRAALEQAIADAGRRGAEPTRFRHRLRHRNGSFRWFETVITPIRGPQGALRQLQSSSRDITEQRETEQSLIKQAFHDELTGLPNTALLFDRLNHALAISRRTLQPIGVLCIGLDKFADVKRSLGSDGANSVLTKVAERLTGIVRPGDTLARIAGDEFVMVCAGTDGARGATAVARRILEAFDRPFVLTGDEIVLRASIGIATSIGADDPTQILDNADTAMYEARSEGRDRFAIHDEIDQSLALERIDTEEALRRAVDNNELRLHYQPELDLDSGRIVGFEALVRWQRPDGRLVPPDEFIPLAEETGIIVELGRWVIAEACRQASLWRIHRTPDQEPVRIWVNLSARQLGDPDLVDFVERTVRNAGISTDEICLEITESALMHDAESATEQLDELRRIGISLGIDDFGTGWSQFAYLQRLPLDVLKIDRSFVSGLATDGASATIVAAIIDLAHALGLIVIAEGVETEDQLQVLRELECDQALGFLFSEPREPAAFDAVLDAN